MSSFIFPEPEVSAINDFTITTGTSGYTKIELSKIFPAGTYVVTSALSDSTYDIYLIAEDSTNAGYVNAGAAQSSITATKPFHGITLYGGTNNDTYTFKFEYVFPASSTSSTQNLSAAPQILSVSPSNVPNIDNTFTIYGNNFATNVGVFFTGTGYSSTAAKSIVRVSSTQLLVTRPDNLPVSGSPYTITVTNPGIPNPTSTNVHILSNSLTSGTNPVWSTSATLPVYTRNVAYSLTLVASDTENSDVDYSIISGDLPSGLSLNQETGLISGTPTVLTTHTPTIRAIDAGGNFVDRAFTLANIGPNNPVWVTTSPLTGRDSGATWSTALAATDDSTANGGVLTYSAVTSLPTGVSLSGNTLSGNGSTPVGSYSFTLRVTDPNGLFSDRTFSLDIVSPASVIFTTTGQRTWTVPTGVSSISVIAIGAGGKPYSTTSYNNAGPGGALAYVNNISVTSGETLYISVPAAQAALGAAQTLNASVARGNYYESGGTGLCVAGSANLDTAGSVLVGTGTGGRAVNGAGGAGGPYYSGTSGGGGSGGTGTSHSTTGATYNTSYVTAGGGGGGTGMYGQGADGSIGSQGTSTTASAGGTGGSGGTSGTAATSATTGTGGNGGSYGAGPGRGARRIRTESTTGVITTTYYDNGTPSPGSVRIIWGISRSFPSTNTGIVGSETTI